MTCFAFSRIGRWLGILGLVLVSLHDAEAGGLFRKRDRTVITPPRSVVPTARVVTPAPLGTFTPTPYMTVRGNFPTGGGYSPNDSFGDTSMDLYGPMSALRSTAAPVATYVRGYDGRTTVQEGTAFSTPNLPTNSPVVYPTQGSYYYRPRTSEDPPWWDKGLNWIDQN